VKVFEHSGFRFLLVFTLAVLQYVNTANHDYAWDDAIVITENSRVQKGLTDIPELFENIKSNETQNRYGYRPIALLSFAADIHFFGLDPKASHRINILLYGLLAMVVLLFLDNLFPESKHLNLIITAIFVVHPLHTEVVANIKSRDEILAMGFGLLSLLFYIRSITVPNWKLLIVSLILIVLAFLSKESAITFVGFALFLPWILFDFSDHRGNLKKIIPLVAAIATLIAIRSFTYSELFFQSNDFDLSEKGLFHEDGYVGNPLFDSDVSGRIATAIFLVPYFIYRFIVPFPLVHDYSYDQFAVQDFGEPMVYVSAIILLFLVIITLYGVSKKQMFASGLLFFLITCSIYLHIVQIAPDIFAERFVFVPSLGLCIALLGGFQLLKFRKHTTTLAIALAVPMFAYSWQRNKAWESNEVLLKTDLPRLTECVRANYNYALFLHGQYYRLPVHRQNDAKLEILRYYEHTMELTDRLFNVYFDLGAAYMEFGQPDKAYAIFQRASKKYPESSLPFVQLGKYHMSFKEYARAIPYFKRAMKNGAKNSDFNYLMAICLFNSGWFEEAIGTILEGEKLGVSSPAYYSLIARLYLKLDQKENAKAALERGLIAYPYDQGLKNELNQIQTTD
jgi:tetratricopeptide (TPR) repeat protein